MPHPGTDPETVAVVRSFAGRIGQMPIVLNKEQSGCVFNHMLLSLRSPALNLATKEVTAVAAIGIQETDLRFSS